MKNARGTFGSSGVDFKSLPYCSQFPQSLFIICVPDHNPEEADLKHLYKLEHLHTDFTGAFHLSACFSLTCAVAYVALKASSSEKLLNTW